MSPQTRPLPDQQRRAAARRPSATPARAVSTPLKALLALVIGTVLGLGATKVALERRFEPAAVHLGPWILWPRSGSPAADPYARAILAQSGQIPVAAAEGVLLVAASDSQGGRLSGRCSYRVAGHALAARLWSVSVTSPDGRPTPNALDRYGFTSTELVRRSDGGFAIELAHAARSGNWLPVPAGPFGLSLHLYESPLGSVSTDPATASLPTIDVQDCAP